MSDPSGVPLLILPLPMPLHLAAALMGLIGAALGDVDTRMRNTATGYEVLTYQPVTEVVAVVEAATARLNTLE